MNEGAERRQGGFIKVGSLEICLARDVMSSHDRRNGCVCVSALNECVSMRRHDVTR